MTSPDAATTLIVSSHVMDEADHCGDLLLLRDGELLADSTPARAAHARLARPCPTTPRSAGPGRPSRSAARSGAGSGSTRRPYYTIPLPPDQGTGLGKPLKLITTRSATGSRSCWPRSARRTRAGRRAGRGLAADLLLPGEGGGLGGRLAAGAGQARPVAAPLGRHRRRPRWPSATTSPPCWSWPGPAGPVHRGDGRARAGTSTTTWPPSTATRRKRPRSRRPTWRAARTRPPRSCRRAARGNIPGRAGRMSPSGWPHCGPAYHVNVAPLASTHAERVRLIEQIRDIAAGPASPPPQFLSPAVDLARRRSTTGRGRRQAGGNGGASDEVPVPALRADGPLPEPGRRDTANGPALERGHAGDGPGRGAVDCAPLQPACGATTVRVRDGETLLTDGPAAEIKEHFGGFTLVECADLDEALSGRDPTHRERGVSGGAPGGQVEAPG